MQKPQGQETYAHAHFSVFSKVLFSLSFLLFNHINLAPCYSNICFCLVWERYSGFPGLQEKAGASQLPNSCRDKNVYLDIMLVLQILGWTKVHYFCAVPPKITRDRQQLGAAHRICPDKAAGGATRGWRAACWKGTPASERLGTHTLPTCRKPPPIQKLTEIRNTPHTEILSQANGAQITHRVALVCFRFLFLLFFKGLWSSTSTSLHCIPPGSTVIPPLQNDNWTGAGHRRNCLLKNQFLWLFVGCYWDILKYILPAEYAGRHSSNTADAFEAEREICGKCKISPTSRSSHTEDCFFRLNQL